MSAPLLVGAPVAMALPDVLRQVLPQSWSLRDALYRIYGHDPANAFYVYAKEIMGRLDGSTGRLFELDARYGLLEKLAPHGTMQQSRKVWSYSGGIRKNRGLPLSMSDGNPGAVRDPGNYCYGLVLRLFADQWDARSWRSYTFRSEYNDAKLGDILEAVLGVAWLCRHGHMTCSPEDLIVLNAYTLAIERCVVDAEKVLDLVDRLGIWTDSKSLAALLV